MLLYSSIKNSKPVNIQGSEPIGFSANRLTPARRRVLDALLDVMLELPSAERAARMRELASSHARVHAWLERLLEASVQPTSFLQTLFERAGDAAISSIRLQQNALPPGTRIDEWRLLEPAGVGGMGLVYRAERADGAFEMSAAIKFIRTPDDALMSERLAVETRLLARLNHPNIARILDGGTLGDGQNYLVMEWIEGEDLAECREKEGVDRRRCLELFIQIAQAVSHAHQRQIVHGDIKPSNIRIAVDGRPRLLDFGVARLISGDPGVVEQNAALTPAFAAPEQLAGDPASTQSDVYALGSLLRWMLSGNPAGSDKPLEPSELDPPRSAALAAIISKASAAQPDQRYESVPELINDIRALLDMKPVSATRNSTPARIALWARRNRLAAGLAGLALASVLGAIAGISWQARIATAERDLARFEAERSSLLREQLVLLFREVGRTRVVEEGTRGALSTRQLLRESVDVAERLHADDPQMLASIKALLGEIHIAMDDYAGAEPLLTAFVDYRPNQASPLMKAMVRADLAQIRLREGASEQALQLTADALEILRESPGANAEGIADVMQIRGQALRGLGRWDEAIAALHEATELAREKPFPSRLRATTNNNLAATLIYAGRSHEALPYLRSSLDNWRELGLDSGSSALTVMANLAGLLHQRGELAEAEPLYREAIRRRRERFGESGALAAAHLNLGLLLAIRNRIDSAQAHVTRGTAMMARFEGRDSVNYARARQARGRVALARDDFDQALDDLEHARARIESIIGPDHLFTAIAEFHAALAEARLADRVTERLTAATGSLEPHRPASTDHLARANCELAQLMIGADPVGAGERARRCLKLRRDELSVSEWMISEARAIVLATRIASGDRSAIPALKEARNALAAVLGADHPKLKWCDRWLS